MDWSDVKLPGVDADTVAVVLGGGGAIGGETVRAFACMGATVCLVTRGAGAVAQAPPGAAGKVRGFVADLAQPASLTALAEEVTRTCGPASVLVNSAAVGATKRDIAEIEHEQAQRIFDVNVLGALNAIKAFVPSMRERGGGKIVNVSSIAAERVVPGGTPYGASKAALGALTRHAAVDLGPSGITVNTVSPGQTPTRLRAWHEEPGRPNVPMESGSGYDNTSVPLRRRGVLEDYVGAILFLCSALADYVTGVDIAVEGGARLVRAKAY